MRAVILDSDRQTAYLISRLLYENHIYNALPDNYKDVFGAHEFLQDIEFGYRIVIGLFADSSKFLGCVHGTLDDGVFTAHLMLRRKVKSVEALLLAEQAFREYSKDKKIAFDFIDGYIPEHNKPAIRAAYKFGCVLLDDEHDMVFLKDGQELPCLHFRKEIL